MTEYKWTDLHVESTRVSSSVRVRRVHVRHVRVWDHCTSILQTWEMKGKYLSSNGYDNRLIDVLIASVTHYMQWCSGKISLVGTLAGHYGHIPYRYRGGGGGGLQIYVQTVGGGVIF